MPQSSTKCIEKQTILHESDLYVLWLFYGFTFLLSLYIIETKTKTPSVPYGESFQVQCRYCIAFDKPNATHVRVTNQTEFFKSVMWESMIEKAAIEGTSNNLKGIANLWQKKQVEGTFSMCFSLDWNTYLRPDLTVSTSQNRKLQ